MTKIVAAAILLLIAGAIAIPGQNDKSASRTTWDGVYTTAQAKRGADAYASKCAACHGDDMAGKGEVPALAGLPFLYAWNGKTAAELVDYIHTSMPPSEPGSLTDQQSADFAAAIFGRCGFPEGSEELKPGASLGGIVIQREKH
jgi:cytochrome c553